MANHRNHTFVVKGGFYTADEHTVEKIIELRLPVSMFIPFANGTGRTGYGIGATKVKIREYKYADEPGDDRFEVEVQGCALTKAGRPDKRGAASDYHYAWVDTAAEVQRLLDALPEVIALTLLDGTTISFTKEQVAAYLNKRVKP